MHQILMYEANWDKTTFMFKHINCHYNILSFNLKNTNATYRRMMNKIFEEEIDEILEVYMYDMIIKFNEEEWQDEHLANVFRRV